MGFSFFFVPSFIDIILHVRYQATIANQTKAICKLCETEFELRGQLQDMETQLQRARQAVVDIAKKATGV